MDICTGSAPVVISVGAVYGGRYRVRRQCVCVGVCAIRISGWLYLIIMSGLYRIQSGWSLDPVCVCMELSTDSLWPVSG